MPTSRAWILNFDADDELARPSNATPSRAVLARFEPLVTRLGLLVPGDIVVPRDAPTDMARAFLGMAWCPTPQAQKALRRAGATLLQAPSFNVLRTVNHRRFNADLGHTLPGTQVFWTLEQANAALSSPSASGPWLLKRAFGFAGRGRLRVDPQKPGDLERAQTWIHASLRTGDGLFAEPLVTRTADFGLHGFLHRSKALILGEPTLQSCDETGAWRGSERARASDLDPEERTSLFEETNRTANALFEAGYFGPFGIDAFRWEDPHKRTRFNARCEINARYSMGWAIGMGDRRPDIEITPF